MDQPPHNSKNLFVEVQLHIDQSHEILFKRFGAGKICRTLNGCLRIDQRSVIQTLVASQFRLTLMLVAFALLLELQRLAGPLSLRLVQKFASLTLL